MRFKDILKAELAYSGLMVKELAALSGVNRRTIDNYLSKHECLPSAESAVKIAQVLGVSVEYLMTGQESHRKNALRTLRPAMQTLAQAVDELKEEDRKIVLQNALHLVEVLKNRGNQ